MVVSDDEILYLMNVNSPSEKIKNIIEKISKLGQAIVAIRGNSFSGNLIGTVGLAEDGRKIILKMSECKCHVHLDWGRITDAIIEEEDVGYGPEPVIRLIDKQKNHVVHFFYPKLSIEKVKKGLE